MDHIKIETILHIIFPFTVTKATAIDGPQKPQGRQINFICEKQYVGNSELDVSYDKWLIR